MKLLKIEKSQGFYSISEDAYKPIDEITKEEILILVNKALSKEDVEFDEYDEELIQNQAHQIIYRSVYEKLKDLKNRRKEFSDESECLFLEEYNRYSS